MYRTTFIFFSRFVLEVSENDDISSVGPVVGRNAFFLLLTWVVIFLCLLRGPQSIAKVHMYFKQLLYMLVNKTIQPSHIAQSVTCLATDASLTADPGVASSIPAWSHTVVEIDHEIISTVILLLSAESFKKGCKYCARSTN